MRPALLVLAFAAVFVIARPTNDAEAAADKGGKGRTKPPKSKPKPKPKPKTPTKPSGDDHKGSAIGDLASTAANGVVKGAAREAGRVAFEKIVGSGEEVDEDATP